MAAISGATATTTRIKGWGSIPRIPYRITKTLQTPTVMNSVLSEAVGNPDAVIARAAPARRVRPNRYTMTDQQTEATGVPLGRSLARDFVHLHVLAAQQPLEGHIVDGLVAGNGAAQRPMANQAWEERVRHERRAVQRGGDVAVEVRFTRAVAARRSGNVGRFHHKSLRHARWRVGSVPCDEKGERRNGGVDLLVDTDVHDGAGLQGSGTAQPVRKHSRGKMGIAQAGPWGDSRDSGGCLTDGA